jgi:hypothetical protein
MKSDLQRGVSLCVRSAPQPFEVQLLLGDAFHNLRSALDHAIFEIVNPAPGAEHTTQFPIVDDDAALSKSQHLATIRNANPKVADVIVNDIKPTKIGNPMLRAIHDVDIIDKHRLLFAVTTIAPVILPTVHDSSLNLWIGNVIGFEAGGEHEIPLGRPGLTILQPPKFPRITTFMEPSGFRGQEVFSVLEAAIGCTTETLDKLEAAALASPASSSTY